MKAIIILKLVLGALLFNSCAPYQEPPVAIPVPAAANPFPIGSHAHFTFKNYPKRSDSYINKSLLAQTNQANSSIVITLAKQRAFLMNGDEIVIDYPVSTGKSGYHTPAGHYKILERVKNKRSNLYGSIIDAAGVVIDNDASSRTSIVPEGASFVGAKMPYWMRFTWSGIGHHVGRVPRYPASHGCIRGKGSILPLVFHRVRVGTPVEIN